MELSCFSKPSMQPAPVIDLVSPPPFTEESPPSQSPCNPNQRLLNEAVLASHSLPRNISIESLTLSTLPAFKRLTLLLLSIRYPDKFFTETLLDTTISSLTRIAIWKGFKPHSEKKNNFDSDEREEDVVGAIRCRLEDVPIIQHADDAQATHSSPPRKQVYVQTLGVLSPFRSLGIATSLLDATISAGIKEYGITSVYAHVWEANEEALHWYARRGFTVEERKVEGYYRRLKPQDARIVRRDIGIAEHVKACTSRQILEE